MPDDNLNSRFEKNGYILVREALTPAEVTALRSVLADAFVGANDAKGKARRVLFPHEILSLDRVYSVVFKPKVVDALKEILGSSYTMFVDLMVQRNMFGHGPRQGWHTDSGSEGAAPYLFEPDYRFVKCGIFLQDNDPDWGGGIDVLPGGHKFPLRTSNHRVNLKAKTVLNTFQRRLFPVQLKIAAGDFVAFDSRLPHTSTFPLRFQAGSVENDHLNNMPSDKTKFVIYWNSCRNQCAADFLRNSERRAEHEEIQGGHDELFFCDYLRLKFPESYPADFADQVRAAGIQVASLDEGAARIWSEKYDEAQKHRQASI